MSGKILKLVLVDKGTGEESNVNPPPPDLSGLTTACFHNINNPKDTKAVSNCIPNKPGCYWIATDEPCTHSFNGQHAKQLKTHDGLTILYNGVTTDLNKRLKDHLLRKDTAGGFGSVSGISVDILDYIPLPGISEKPKTHVKHAYTNDNKKLPKVLTNGKYEPVDTKEKLLKHMTSATFYEKRIVMSSDTSYFKNGISVWDRKHQKYKWVFIFMPIENDFIRSYIEITWRQDNGGPPLASYISGR